MADIALGTSITGAFTTEDPRRAGYSLDQYDLTGLDGYRQLTIELTATNATTPLLINLIDTKTGNVVAVKEAAANGQGKISLSNTTVPGGSYRLLVGGQSGSYTVATIDGGKATSIVTPLTARDNGDGSKTDVGTVGQNGQFFALASSTTNTDRILYDIALGADQTKLYGIGTNAQEQDILFKIDPSRATTDQVTEIGFVKDSANNILSINLNALAFAPDGQLYTIGSGSSKLYTVNLTTAVATSVGDLPEEFISSGDLVYDAAGSRFLAASVFQSLADSSTLWSIPIAAPATATKLGTIGFPGVKGLSFENGQLKGFTGGDANAVGDRITINTTTAVGTFETKIGRDAIAPINDGIGGATTITIGATPPTPATTIKPRADFNGDSKSDILWRNDDGSVALWQMNGPDATSTLVATLPDWKIANTGDFNGDGKSDILWRNDDGQVAIWNMNGSTFLPSSGLTSVPTVDNSWKIAGTGDFGGDNKSDILWRNNDGSVAIWNMDGTNVLASSGSTSTPVIDISWKTAGTGDFNGDGKSDILWRNDDGSVALWQMDGANVVSSKLTSTPSLDRSWKINGTGDFSGDGKADILWRKDSGEIVIWTMDGANVISSQLTSTPSVDSSWKINGTGDFNGDGKADILWRKDSGATAVWEMNGTNVVASTLTSIQSESTTWKIAAPIL